MNVETIKLITEGVLAAINDKEGTVYTLFAIDPDGNELDVKITIEPILPERFKSTH
jgi:hypothetical protein